MKSFHDNLFLKSSYSSQLMNLHYPILEGPFHLQQNDLKVTNIFNLLPNHCQTLYFTSPFLYGHHKYQTSAKKNSLWLKIRHHCYQIFPTAYCASRDIELTDNNEGNEFHLPGTHMKRKTASQMQAIGEYEINQLMETESGWDRIKDMYRTKSGSFEDEGTQALNTMFYRTVIIGFFINVLVGSQNKGKALKNLSKTEALRTEMASKGLNAKGIMVSALKDTLKLSVLAFSLFHMSQMIAAYRNKTSVWEYTLSSAVGFSVLGLSHGVAATGVYGLGGALVGSIGGYIVCRFLQNAGLTQELRSMKRMQQRITEQRSEMGKELSEVSSI